ncbi:hypothetical protein [Hyphomicrobium sp.]|uniref:hypothetical protein n=1 Tax=Hyphomicrobium sp. TaxID=82 RepID=UPI002E3221D9|nr:hypothetical protein [Hyphomicrobium sp.]HEX2843201.1 hypothetical protein [Hyphomicrobium sp.]
MVKEGICSAFVAIAAVTITVVMTSIANAAPPEIMEANCRGEASEKMGLRMPDIETKYKKQEADGTHTVSGTAYVDDGEKTFQCTLDAAGDDIVGFKVN